MNSQVEDPEINRLLRSDWASIRIPARRSLFIDELIIMSLLYDEVVLTDETLALYPKIAQWFDDVRFRDFEELLSIGSICVLKHPIFAYPEDLREEATTSPIATRALYLSRLSTFQEARFAPNDQQLRFYKRLDACLLTPKHRKSSRYVNFEQFEIMPAFSKVLMEILNNPKYDPWLNRRYSGRILAEWIETRRIFTQMIQDPILALKRLESFQMSTSTVLDDDGRPILNRSFATRVAHTMPMNFRLPLSHLIQSSFAAPFLWREGAIGTYNRQLVELPFHNGQEIGVEKEMSGRMSVETHVSVPLKVPELRAGFGTIIRQTRESREGRRLRRSINNAITSESFQEQTNNWREVADLLAAKVVSKREFQLKALVLSLSSAIAIDSFVDFSSSNLLRVKPELDATAPQLSSIIGSTATGLLVSYLSHLRADVEDHVRIRQSFEDSVNLRCTQLSSPDFLWPLD